MTAASRRGIRILLADDHPVVRAGLAAVLATQGDFEVVAEAGDGGEAVALAQAHRVDVMLLDLEMPVFDGVEVIRRLREVRPDTKVVVFTAFDTDERIVAAIEAGAQGYLLKGVPREDIFQAIRVVQGGGALLQPMVATKLLRQVREQPESLTPRELEVLTLLARGSSNKALAEALHISERTVKFHVSAILGKLGASNRTQAVAVATARGLLGPRRS